MRADFRARLALTILLVCGTAVAAGPKPLQCPEGTELTREPGNRGDRLEICKDGKSGAQHGPARLYDSNDKLIMEMVNDSGRETSRAFTPAGVARYIKDVNESKRFAKQPRQYLIVNAQTLRYIVTSEQQGETLDEQEVHTGLAKGEACLLLQLPGATFKTLEMRVQSPGGKVWFHTEIAREECVKH